MKLYQKLRVIRKYVKPTLVPNRLKLRTSVVGIIAISIVAVVFNNSTTISDKPQVQPQEAVAEISSFQLDKMTHAPELTTPEIIKQENPVTQEPAYVETQMFTTSNVNLREQPTTDSNVVTKIGNSELLTAQVIEGDGWYFVEYKSQTGYINSKYLREYDSEIHLELGLEYTYQDLVREYIEVFDLDVDEYFFYGMIYTENRFKQEPESEAGAQGILQIIPSTWNFLYKDFCTNYPEYSHTIVDDASDKTSNIILGMYYMKYLQDYYGFDSLSEHASQILTTYNRGPENARAYYKSYGTYSSGYSQEILRAADYIRENKRWKEGI